MKKKIAALLSTTMLMTAVLSGCSFGSKDSLVKYKQIDVMTTVNKEKNEIEIRVGDTLGDILDKLQAPYQESFEKVETAEVASYKVNGQKVDISIENFKIGHYTVDNLYAVQISYKTGKESLLFCFNMAYSDEDLRKVKLEAITIE